MVSQQELKISKIALNSADWKVKGDEKDESE